MIEENPLRSGRTFQIPPITRGRVKFPAPDGAMSQRFQQFSANGSVFSGGSLGFLPTWKFKPNYSGLELSYSG